MLYTKFQLNISSGSGETVDFIGFAIFSNSGHFYSDALQPCHAASEI